MDSTTFAASVPTASAQASARPQPIKRRSLCTRIVSLPTWVSPPPPSPRSPVPDPAFEVTERKEEPNLISSNLYASSNASSVTLVDDNEIAGIVLDCDSKPLSQSPSSSLPGSPAPSKEDPQDKTLLPIHGCARRQKPLRLGGSPTTRIRVILKRKRSRTSIVRTNGTIRPLKAAALKTRYQFIPPTHIQFIISRTSQRN